VEQIEYPAPPAWSKELLTIGVTGTNGKTTTTLYAAAALAALGRPVASVTTLGHTLDAETLPLEPDYDGFIQTLERAHARGGRYAAIELTSEALASGFMRAWPCRIGVFTNLSHDHLAAHGSAEHYLASKAQLFVELPVGGIAVLNRADPASELLAEVVPAHATIVGYANASHRIGDLDWELDDIEPSWSGTRFRVRTRAHGTLALSIRAIGAMFAENAVAALAAAVAAGAEMRDAAELISRAPAAAGRFELVSEQPRVVVDYAHSPDALARTLETARSLGPRRTILVFGAGGGTDREKREPMGRIAARAERVFITNDNPRDEDPRQIARDLQTGVGDQSEVTIELDRARAIELALGEAGIDDLVLVAGKGHESRQTIGGRSHPFSDRERILRHLGR
jgi:UDP-N-acetylmuramoyl-L-alanyl-D-glutamate--2,6-diaminopimelate ligase